MGTINLKLQNPTSTLNNREREVINLVVSHYNGCKYCPSAHTIVDKLNGFTGNQIHEIRSGSASFDCKLDALAKFTLSAASNKGNASNESKIALLKAGYSQANLIEAIITVADKTVSNYVHNITGIKIDFPPTHELESAA